MTMEWNEYWSNLIEVNKMSNMVEDMDKTDMDMHGECRIEDICHSIYNDYPKYKMELEKVRLKLLTKVEEFPEVHLQTSRVKQLDSLLLKVIKKRSNFLLSKDNLYATISGDNYKDILTDLVGIRLIISYRGKWIDLHNKIIKEFPYADNIELYQKGQFIPHPENKSSILAEIPKVYHAYRDDLTFCKDLIVDTEIKDNGYRSTHYVVSFEGVYVEIQTRTIYDEAWSDCDHNYVYKKDFHPSHSALKEMSAVLGMLTNASNDLEDRMYDIYENNLIVEKDGKYNLEQRYDLQLDDIFAKIKDAEEQLKRFKELVRLRGDHHEE